MKEPYQQVRGMPDENGEFRRGILALPQGDYAVVAVHDVNDNGQFDKGFLGFGAEPYGFSNGVRQLFFRPHFDQVKIRVDQPGTLVEIDLD